MPGATAYDVYRYLDKALTQGDGKPGDTITALSFEDTALTKDTQYYYRVKAKYDIFYDSDFSLSSAAGMARTGAFNPTLTPLTKGVATVSQDGKLMKSSNYFYIDVPAGATRLVATLTGTNKGIDNDCDLLAKFANMPTATSFNAKGVENDTTETMTISNPAAGTWYFLLYGKTDYTGVTLTVDYYSVSDIVLTQVPLNDLAVPFKTTFKGKVVDEFGNRNPEHRAPGEETPLTGLTSSLMKTDKSGIFTYATAISSEGEYTFDFFFSTIPDACERHCEPYGRDEEGLPGVEQFLRLVGIPAGHGCRRTGSGGCHRTAELPEHQERLG